MNNKNEFDYKNLLELRKLTIDEVEQYYRELRKYNYENDIPVKGIELRKKTNKALLTLIKINRLINRQKLHVVGDKRVETERPKIFAVTHIGRFDIEIGVETIKDSNFLVIGNQENLYKDLDGLLLYVKGFFIFNMDDKLDRKILEDRCKQVLNNKGNVFLFPEGAWNLTPNETVMKLYEGTVRMAKETGAEIIPVAIEQYGKEYYTNVGKNIVIDENENKSNRELSDDLRDTLATLKWDIWEQFPVTERKALSEDYDELHKEFVNKIMSESDEHYTVEEIEDTRYKDRNHVSEEEAFGFMKTLTPNKENAFLYKKQK